MPRVNHVMLHGFPLQASESQFEFRSNDGTDDRAHFKLMVGLVGRFCAAVGLK